MGGHAAVVRAGQRGVRAALAVRQHRRAAAGELLRVVLAGVGRLGLGLGELGVRLDVDLPARQARGEPGVEAVLADRERELVVRDDDGRLARVVVDVDLAHAGRRERLGDEPGRLGVPRDDVDLLAAQLGHDHAHPRASRADAGADRVDALGVRLDRDLRAVARLARDAADLDETVGDLGNLELEQRLDQLRVAARQDHLRALRARPHLGDHGLDPRALLVALAVDLLGARQQCLDAAEVDEHVVAVARLLHDAGHDLALPVDVLVVHHRALGLADALLDDLLGRHRGDAPEALRRHVGAHHQILRNLRPVELEIDVVDERVLALAGLLLDALELVDRRLARLLDEPLLEVARDLDREHAELALVVEDHLGVPGGARRLLVRSEERVLERRDERARLDALLALDRANAFHDLLAHELTYPSSIRLPRTIVSYGMSSSVSPTAIRALWSVAATTVPRKRFLPAMSAAVRS